MRKRKRQIAFTVATLSGLQPESERYDIWDKDNSGFGARVSKSGRVSVFYFYKSPTLKKQRRLSLGDFDKTQPHVSISELFNLYKESKQKVELGIDPAEPDIPFDVIEPGEEQKELKADDKIPMFVKSKPETLDELICAFYHRFLAINRKRPVDAYNTLDRDFSKSEIYRKNISEIKRSDIYAVIDSIVGRGKNVTANRFGSLTRQMFDFAEHRGWIDENPFPVASRRRMGGHEKPSTRSLTNDEINRMWAFMSSHETGFDISIGLTIRLLLLTGQRVSELLNAKHSHFDLKQSMWTIPVELQKDSAKRVLRPHKVPLSKSSEAIVRYLLEINSDSEWVVPMITDKRRPLDHRQINRAIARNLKRMKVAKFTTHDLRRTFETRIEDIKGPNDMPLVEPWLVEKMVNHKLEGVFEVYNHNEYLDARKSAMTIWERHLMGIVGTRWLDDIGVIM